MAFKPDIQKLAEMASGDVGVTRGMFASLLVALSPLVPEASANAFTDSMTPKTGQGLLALEKTAVTSMLDTMKPLTELAVGLSELMTALESVTSKIANADLPGATEDLALTVPTVIADRVRPAMEGMTKLVEDPAGAVGAILSLKLSEHFHYFDPSKRSGTVTLPEGSAGVTLLGKQLGLTVAGGAVSPGVASPVEQPLLKFLLNVIKLPVELISGVLKYATDFLAKVLDVSKVVDAVKDFLSFGWLKELLSLEGLVALVDIPGMGIPEVSLSQFFELVKGLVTAFVSMPEAMFGVKLS